MGTLPPNEQGRWTGPEWNFKGPSYRNDLELEGGFVYVDTIIEILSEADPRYKFVSERGMRKTVRTDGTLDFVPDEVRAEFARKAHMLGVRNYKLEMEGAA